MVQKLKIFFFTLIKLWDLCFPVKEYMIAYQKLGNKYINKISVIKRVLSKTVIK